jgi:hypothetical protein
MTSFSPDPDAYRREYARLRKQYWWRLALLAVVLAVADIVIYLATRDGALTLIMALTFAVIWGVAAVFFPPQHPHDY